MAAGGRKLRNISARQAVRAFEKLGYKRVRVRGSHHILKHPERGILVIPVHRDAVKVGILLDALDRAGISVDEFERMV